MGLPLVPMSELDAVNVILMTVGEQPVNTLETPGLSEVSIARTTLHQVSRKVQAEGFVFNTEEGYRIPPDLDGHINLPPNTLRVTPTDRSRRLVQRGTRLYDIDNKTFKFKDPVELDLVLFLPFEELSQAARDYITIRAAREFQTRVLGSEKLTQLTAFDEQQAYLALIREDSDARRYNMMRSPDMMQRLRRR